MSSNGWDADHKNSNKNSVLTIQHPILPRGILSAANTPKNVWIYGYLFFRLFPIAE